MKQPAAPTSPAQRRVVWFWVRAALLFLFAFCVLPVTAWVYLGWDEVRQLLGHSPSSINFPDALHISNGEKLISIAAAPELEPTADEDFLLTGWFKIAVLPGAGERLVLLEKYDRGAPGIPGYALGLENHGHEILPVVYWRSVTGEGRWFRFAKLLMAPRDWVFLALSLHDGKVLALHAGVARGAAAPKVRVLGGYHLDPPVSPNSAAALLWGSGGPSRFKGWIGPFGIFSREKLHEDFARTFKDLTRRPGKPPSTVTGREVRLWSTDGRSDLSSFKRVLELVREAQTPARNPDASKTAGLEAKKGEPLRTEKNKRKKKTP